MSFVRNLSEERAKKVNGEKVFEMVTERDKKKLGAAIVLVRESKLHHHDYTEEMYFVASENPKAVVYLDGAIISLKHDDVVYIAPGTKHKLETHGPEDLKIYVATHPPWSQKDHHLDE